MIKYYYELDQGSEEWLAARCGNLTASEMKLILTPTLKLDNNDKERAHVYELAAQRISGYVEPQYISDDMIRGMRDEVAARIKYEENYAPVTECGFITNSSLGFTVGYSPDGLVGDDGLIEAKSRRQRFQIETIAKRAVPDEYMLQLQTGLFVTGRKWIDFISYSAGLPMVVIRVYPEEEYQSAIIEAATKFNDRVESVIGGYTAAISDKNMRLVPTVRQTDDFDIL